MTACMRLFDLLLARGVHRFDEFSRATEVVSAWASRILTLALSYLHEIKGNQTSKVLPSTRVATRIKFH